MNTPMDILKEYPVRKSERQKKAFRKDIISWLEAQGYSVSEEEGSFHCKNVVIGDSASAKYLITAHYDTCARLPVPNLITPCNFWPFLLYQLFILLLLLVPAAALGILAGYLTKISEIGTLVYEVVLLLSICMMMVGPANPSNVNDNTSGVVSVLEIARSLPELQRKGVCFVLFDLEEAGLIGSASYAKKHKSETANQLVLNLDCVGEGDEIYFFPTAKLKKKEGGLAPLESIVGRIGKKSISIRRKGFSFYPSDQANFPNGVGICALRRGKLGLYLSRIHTPKDKILDETNVNILRAALITLVTGSKAQ